VRYKPINTSQNILNFWQIFESYFLKYGGDIYSPMGVLAIVIYEIFAELDIHIIATTTDYKWVRTPVIFFTVSGPKCTRLCQCELRRHCSLQRFLPRDASVERGYEIAYRLSVRLSVCPSVTIRYRDHTGWNSSKRISRPNSLRPMRSLTPNMGDLVLNGGNAPLAKINKNSGAHQKNLNEVRPISLEAKCRPMDLFSRNIKYMRMFVGVPSEW